MYPNYPDVGPNNSSIQAQSIAETGPINRVNELSTTVTVNERTPLLTEHAHYDLDRNTTYIHVLFMFALSTFLFIGVGTAVYLLISEGTDWITWSTYSLVKRSDWNAERSISTLVPYDKEITRIILVSTQSNSCFNEGECCDIVRNLQNYQIHALNEPDITYNFLIGNDGQIYEGTGWKTKLEITNKYRNNTIVIALIGESNDPVFNNQAETTKTFLEVSVNRKLINKCFTILVPYDYKATDYYLIDFAANLQRYSNRFCSEKLLFF